MQRNKTKHLICLNMLLHPGICLHFTLTGDILWECF